MLGVAAAVERRGADDALRLWGRGGVGEAQEAQSRDGGDGGEELHFVGLASDLIMGLSDDYSRLIKECDAEKERCAGKERGAVKRAWCLDVS